MPAAGLIKLAWGQQGAGFGDWESKNCGKLQMGEHLAASYVN